MTSTSCSLWFYSQQVFFFFLRAPHLFWKTMLLTQTEIAALLSCLSCNIWLKGSFLDEKSLKWDTAFETNALGLECCHQMKVYLQLVYSSTQHNCNSVPAASLISDIVLKFAFKQQLLCVRQSLKKRKGLGKLRKSWLTDDRAKANIFRKIYEMAQDAACWCDPFIEY